jgi:uroporphyrin-III C-methyltransferase
MPQHTGRSRDHGVATASGTVYLVGAGPGAADLLTLRAVRVLQRADVVFHDALVSPDILALAGRAQLVAVGKRCGRFSTAQQFINRQLVRAARQHQTVVRLKGGDPMMFGRAQEELDGLHQHGINTEVVPGISAAFAASAELQQSLTQRGRSRSVVFVTPRIGPDEQASDWVRAALAADTVVLYMGGHQLTQIGQTLIAGGMSVSRPAVIVAGAARHDRQTVASTVGRMAQGSVVNKFGDAPVLLLMGAVYAELLAQSERLEPRLASTRAA